MTDSAPYFADLAAGPPGGHARWCHADDGTRLRAVIWPVTDAKGTVLILPGRTEHAEKYGRTAAELAQRGYASIALDWRGQGLSDRLLPDRRIGHVARFADYQRDLDAFVSLLGTTDLPGPRFMLAHSMGGAIGLRALIRGVAVRAAVFSAPMWGILVPRGQQRLFEALTRGAQLLGLGTRYAPPPATGPASYVQTAPFADNSLTTDPEMFAEMKRHFDREPDLLVAGPSLQWLHEALAECRALRLCPSPAVPALAAIGSRERVVDTGAVVQRMQRWPGGQLLKVEGAEHEMLMETPDIKALFLDSCVTFFANSDLAAASEGV